MARNDKGGRPLSMRGVGVEGLRTGDGGKGQSETKDDGAKKRFHSGLRFEWIGFDSLQRA